MNRTTLAWTLYGVSLLLFVCGGVWARGRLGGTREDLRRERAQLEEMRLLLKGAASNGSRPGSPSSPGAGRRPDVGGAVQRAASVSRLGIDAIDELSAVGTYGEQSSAYRLRLRSVEAEALVRFMYALETEAGIRATELEMTQEGSPTGTWTVNLLLVEPS